MAFFSRLTDIVTCNLADLLRGEPAPDDVLRQIIAEMEEGLTGARRSVATAAAAADRLQSEIQEHRGRVAHWAERARSELAAGREDQARVALVRKQELEDVIAGLEQQFEAAVGTREHLSTTLRALEARLHEARRKLLELESGVPGQELAIPEPQLSAVEIDRLDDARARQIDAELAELKRALGQAE